MSNFRQRRIVLCRMKLRFTAQSHKFNKLVMRMCPTGVTASTQIHVGTTPTLKQASLDAHRPTRNTRARGKVRKAPVSFTNGASKGTLTGTVIARAMFAMRRGLLVCIGTRLDDTGRNKSCVVHIYVCVRIIVCIK